ncbi:transposable element Tcb2 transposase [Trichonephila clavipes]|nr:transposable element Tcb2 transposase [Trichonephila clavipes]
MSMQFFFHVCSSRDSVHKSFKGFDACGQLLFQVKVLQERFNRRTSNFWHVFPTSHRGFYAWPNCWKDRREGRKITDVAREFDIAHSVISQLWNSFKSTGICSRWHGGGRVRSTAPAEDRYIVLSAKLNRLTTVQQVANQFLAASGKQISRKTVARLLRGGALYSRIPVVCVPLTRQNRTARLQWCCEHHNWTEQDWACVVFSDDSRFSLSSDCRRQLIWRESGIAYLPDNIQEKDPYPTCSIMVWAGIMINGRTRLHVVANGTMMGKRYFDEVLLPHVRLFRGAVGDKFVFMDDNATCHRTIAVLDCLDSGGIQRLVWPAQFQDLNPIENVWDALGRQVAGRDYPPTNKNTLIRALTEEWDKLPQQLLDNVVQSPLVNLCGLHGIQALLITYARPHRHWTAHDWKHVDMSDESRFELNRADIRALGDNLMNPWTLHVNRGLFKLVWLCGGKGRVQLAFYGIPNMSRYDSDS